MKHSLLLLLLLVLSWSIMAQEKIGNKIYKYGDLNHSIQGTTLISFEDADAKSMSKTLEYFSKSGANIKSYNTLFLPGTEVSEDTFMSMLNKSNIETLILIEVVQSSKGTMNKTTGNAYATVNRKKGQSTAVSGSVQTTKTVDYTTEMNLRLTIFSKKDGFNAPVGVVEGRATNDSPDTTADQLARRIVRRMAKALDEQNAFSPF